MSERIGVKQRVAGVYGGEMKNTGVYTRRKVHNKPFIVPYRGCPILRTK